MTRRRSIEVNGMSCGGCERTVENALKTVSGVHRVDANHETETVDVAAEDDVSDDDLATAVHEAGYEVVA